MLRRTNARVVLNVLRESGAQAVTELQQLTGLSRPTVDAVVDDLISWGLLAATVRPAGRSGGRPARRLAFRPEAAHVLGVDIGRHAVTATVADLSGIGRSSDTQPLTAQMSAGRRLTAMRHAIQAALAAANLEYHDIIAAGAGSPGPVDAVTGTIGTCHVLAHWDGFPLGRHLSDLLGCPVAVEKDANLAAIAEVWRGSGRDRRNTVALMVGERPGAGLILDGQLVHGSLGWAGELYFWGEWNQAYSHVDCRITDRTRPIVAQIAREAAPSDGTAYRPSAAVNIDLSTAVSAMQAGDSDAAEAVHRFVAGAIWTISTISSLLGPDRIIVSGLPSPIARPLVDGWQDLLDELVPENPTELCLSELGDQAVILGALRQALDLAEERLIPEAPQ